MNKHIIFFLFLVSFIAYAFSFKDDKKRKHTQSLVLSKASAVDSSLWSDEEIDILISMLMMKKPQN
jgi:hypothetical protein